MSSVISIRVDGSEPSPFCHCERSEAISYLPALHGDCHGTACLAMNEQRKHVGTGLPEAVRGDRVADLLKRYSIGKHNAPDECPGVLIVAPNGAFFTTAKSPLHNTRSPQFWSEH